MDRVSRPAKNDFSFPAACTLRFRFAARADVPAVDLFWYDGGMKPRLPEQVEAHNVEIPREGVLFVGTQGTIMAGFHGQNPQLFAGGKSESLWKDDGPPQGAGRGRRGSRAWLDACKGGQQSPGSFLNAGPITDTVNLGAVALRAGKKVLFDSENMKITNHADANKHLVRQYRKGWDL